MPYRFAQDRDDYTDFAAGQVLYSLPAQPAFPVRLTTEIFQRCRTHLLRLGRAHPYTVYDPFCGSAHLLVTLAYLHWPEIHQIIGSDVDPAIIPLAKRNLSLITPAGMEARIEQLGQLYEAYGNASHAQALTSARRLQARLLDYRRRHAITSHIFVANALNHEDLLQHPELSAVDLIISDLPYGQQSTWITADQPDAPSNPAWQLLDTLQVIASPSTIIALTSNKQQKIAHDGYQRVEQFQIGKRRIGFFRLRP
jgi:23S rRNA G2445 N2-methylase RlmL